MITGTSGRRAFALGKSSRPLMPGMLMSERIKMSDTSAASVMRSSAAEAVKRRAMALFRERKQATLWHDYGPTLAAEELAEQHGVAMSRETLRK